ncbi:hypothetical protein KYY02_17015 [Streptomyces pimonensis]|uniref:Uncharacterized protein n=1 Tax=Streptomyces pimonensis TaxID=2860288 RepID=A0ABV4J295_9ACTN
MPMTHEQYEREQQMRAELETGFTDYDGFVGWVICPAREKCPSGLRGVFKPLKNGRLPMHRHGTYGEPCIGARQKPMRPAPVTTEEPR